MGCCPNAANPNREPGCKAGAPLPLSTTLKNVLVMGDSVSMGYTPWVQKALGVDKVLVQHSVWGDGSTLCNRTTDPPCDPDPTHRYTGDGGDEETAYGVRCLDFMLAHPDIEDRETLVTIALLAYGIYKVTNARRNDSTLPLVDTTRAILQAIHYGVRGHITATKIFDNRWTDQRGGTALPSRERIPWDSMTTRMSAILRRN